MSARDDGPDDPGAAGADAAWGTAALDAPPTRAELERALRRVNLALLDLRRQHVDLVAQVLALTDEVTRRVDGVEPAPAPPGTPAAPAQGTVEAEVERHRAGLAEHLHARDARDEVVVELEDATPSKYEQPSPDIPCEELLHLCQARCCSFAFALSSEDLDEGVIRWDYGKPYLIRQRATDRYCVHNDPVTRACSVHAHRPRVCRGYDCREDPRVWVDFERRIIAARPDDPRVGPAGRAAPFDLLGRARARAFAVWAEERHIADSAGDDGPVRGPRVTPRRR